MFGDILYTNKAEDYQETLLAEERSLSIRLVVCAQYGVVKLYRLEWEDRTESGGYQEHLTLYSLPDALLFFRSKVQDQKRAGQERAETTARQLLQELAHTYVDAPIGRTEERVCDWVRDHFTQIVELTSTPEEEEDTPNE